MENNIDFQYTINNPDNINCIFELNASGTVWGNIVGNIVNQTDLQEALNSKQDVLTAGDNIQITNGVISATDTTYTAGTGISIENGVISNTQISAIWGNIQGTLANQTDLQNTLDLMNEQIEANHEEIGEIGQTIGTYGDIVTYNAANFATFSQGLLANTALQPNDNISELNNNVGYITSAALPTDYVPETRTINGYALTSNIILNYSDVGALSSSTTINNLTTTSQLNALNSGATTTNIGQIATNTSNIADINALIPAQATTSNQLADKDFVNSSIATNTAYFIGTFNSVAELEAYSGTLTNNDYAFVATTDSAGNTLYDRYKYNADTQQWIFEYELNNSSFTAQQWASINSGITSGDVTLIGTALQPNDNISELVNNVGYITSSALSGYATENFVTSQGYITGITSNDVTTALGYIPYNSTNPNGYITSSALTNYVTTDTQQTISGNKIFSGRLRKSFDSYNELEIGTNAGYYSIIFFSGNGNIPWHISGSGYTGATLTIDGFYTTTLQAGNNSDSYLRLAEDSLIFHKSDNTSIDLLAGGGGTVDQTYDGTSTNAQSGVAIEGELANYQTTSNLVTSISSSSTDAQYPSAKCVYDIVGDIESILHNINSGS